MFKTIRGRLLWPIIIVVIVATILGSLAISSYTVNESIKNAERFYHEAALTYADITRVAWQNEEDLQQTIKRYTQSLNETRVTLVAMDGTVLADSVYNPATLDNHLNRPEISQAIIDGYSTSQRKSQISGEENLYVAVLVTSTLDNKNLAVVRVSAEISSVKSSVESVVAVYIALLIALSLVVIVFVYFISNGVIKPIKKLQKASAKISEGEFAEAVVKNYSQDEIGQLTIAFNNMAGNLQETLSLAQSEQNRLRAIINKMADGLILIDKDFFVRLVNKSARKMFNISPDNNERLDKVTSIAEISSTARLALAENNEQERHFETQDGRYIHMIVVPLSYDEQQGALLLFQDLSETHSLQTIKKDFLANLAHDMRTPIAAIKASAETLSEGALHDEKAAPIFLEHIDSAADKMASIVDEIIDLSHLESGEVVLNIEEIDTRNLLNDTTNSIRNAASRKNVSIKVEVSPNFVFRADSERIRQALRNLAHNALKFTSENGEIILKGTEDVEENVILSVYNSGRGLSAADTERVFERFYKADKSRADSGTGLGLSIVKHIVNLHGGRTWAESKQGKYAEFFILIPPQV